MTDRDEDMNEWEGEVNCKDGGSYGLCKSHPTCEMVQTILAEMYDAIKSATLCVGTASMRAPLNAEEVKQVGQAHIVLIKYEQFRKFWPNPKEEEDELREADR